jgi:Phage stabilisation protein
VQDARLMNCYAEYDPHTEDFDIVKRPGLDSYMEKDGVGRGVYNWRGDIYSIFGSTLYKNNAAIGTVDTTNGEYRFDQVLGATPKLILGNGVKAYWYDGASFANINDVNFPSTFVKGWAYLDGTLYVMTEAAEILGCTNLDDVVNWDPLNSIIARIEPDKGVALAKQNSYVIAFKQWTTEAFYDAANEDGSPLAPVQGAQINLGCQSADSVQEIDGTLLWLTSNRKASPQIARMDSLKAAIVSTPAVERILDDADFTTVISWSIKRAGHRFYLLTLPESNVTLVYDLDQNLWYRWTDANGNYWPIISQTYSAGTLNAHFAQHQSNGKLYILDGDNVYPNDDGEVFSVDIYTPNFDWGVDRRKHLNVMRFNADQQPGSLLYVRHSDNDYREWTNFRPVSLAQRRPMLTNCGTFYRRAWHFRHQSNTPFRMRSIDLQLNLGTL